METLEQIVARNLTELRRARGMTQAELAERINYSDKSVSKWERGDGLPDLKVLKQLADLFGVTLDELVSPNGCVKEVEISPKRNKLFYRVATEMMAVCTVLLVAVAVFIYTSLYSDAYWMAFVWAIPVSSLLLAIFSQLWNFSICTIVFRSTLCWSLLATVYLQLLITDSYNVWMIFLIGAPVQATIILWALLQRHRQ